jgi:succinate dehydrogenase flavin-adding protein (antitoxin of CptAB toxin-antitoxin module)
MSVAPQANQAAPAGGLPPLPPPPVYSDIEHEVTRELGQQTAPLEQMAAGYGAAETTAIGQLGELYAGIMPFVQGSAERVAQMYGSTMQAQQQVFNQAYTRLNDLRSQRAGEAQALAQQLGAPVPLDMFTSALDVERSAAAPEFAGGLLKSQGLAQAGVQEAEAFAGRVMPLQRVRLEQETHQYFRDKISNLNDQIAQIKSQSGGMINERLRQKQLDYYNMQLDRAKTQYEMWRGKQELKLSQKQFALTKRQQLKAEKQQKFENIMTQKGMSLERARFQAQKMQFAQQMGLSMKELDAKLKDAAWARKHGAGALKDQEFFLGKRQELVDTANALLTGTPGKTKVVMVENPKTGIKEPRTVVEEAGAPPMGYLGPMKVLRALVAKVGVGKSQKRLYNAAIAQVIRSYEAAGYTNIPKDPTKWKTWWTKLNARGGYRPPSGPPSPKGTVEWIWNPKTKKYEKRISRGK